MYTIVSQKSKNLNKHYTSPKSFHVREKLNSLGSLETYALYTFLVWWTYLEARRRICSRGKKINLRKMRLDSRLRRKINTELFKLTITFGSNKSSETSKISEQRGDTFAWKTAKKYLKKTPKNKQHKKPKCPRQTSIFNVEIRVIRCDWQIFGITRAAREHKKKKGGGGGNCNLKSRKAKENFYTLLHASRPRC